MRSAAGSSPEAFGAGVAAELGGIATQLYKKEQEADEARVRDQYRVLRSETTRMLSDAQSIQGKDVLDSSDGMSFTDRNLLRFRDVATKLQEELPTERQRKRFNELTGELELGVQDTLLSHQRREIDKHLDESLQADQDQSLLEINSPQASPAISAQAVASMRATATNYAELNGMDKDLVLRKAMTPLHEAVASRMAGMGDLAGARQYLKDNASEIDPRLMPRVQSAVSKSGEVFTNSARFGAVQALVDEVRLLPPEEQDAALRKAAPDEDTLKMARTELSTRRSAEDLAQKDRLLEATNFVVGHALKGSSWSAVAPLLRGKSPVEFDKLHREFNSARELSTGTAKPSVEAVIHYQNLLHNKEQLSALTDAQLQALSVSIPAEWVTNLAKERASIRYGKKDGSHVSSDSLGVATYAAGFLPAGKDPELAVQKTMVEEYVRKNAPPNATQAQLNHLAVEGAVVITAQSRLTGKKSKQPIAALATGIYVPDISQKDYLAAADVVKARNKKLGIGYVASSDQIVEEWLSVQVARAEEAAKR